MAEKSEKKRKHDHRPFRENWTKEYGFLEENDRAVCVFCCGSVVCRTSSVQRHFLTKHLNQFKTPEEKSEAIDKAISGFKEHTDILRQAVGGKKAKTSVALKFKRGKGKDTEKAFAGFKEQTGKLRQAVGTKNKVTATLKDKEEKSVDIEKVVSVFKGHTGVLRRALETKEEATVASEGEEDKIEQIEKSVSGVKEPTGVLRQVVEMEDESAIASEGEEDEREDVEKAIPGFKEHEQTGILSLSQAVGIDDKSRSMAAKSKEDKSKDIDIQKSVSGFKEQTGNSNIGQTVGTKDKIADKIAECLALKGRPFTDGGYIKETFLRCAEILFDDLTNKETILSQIKEIPVSGRSVERRLTDLHDRRSFQENWSIEYGFVEQNDRAVCVFCCESVVCRTSSVQRHFQAKHQSQFKTKTSEKKSETIKKAISGFKELEESGILRQAIQTKNEATECSYKIAQCLALKGRPFTYGGYIKETFLHSAEILFDDLTNKEIILSRIKEIPVSARSIERRMTDLAKNVATKQTTGLKQSQVFSVALVASTDLNDLSRLAVIARYNENNCIYEELCCLLSLQNTTKPEDILNAFVNHFDKNEINLSKLFCVTTDGASAMVDKENGFIKLLEDHVGRKLLNCHCIIQQENLCAKTSFMNLASVMSTVVKIIKFLISHSSFVHWQFKSLLQEIEWEYGDLLLHKNVRWLGRGKVLSRFVCCFEAIKAFLHDKQKHFPQLNDANWLLKLTFLTDINTHLNELNLKLQGQGQTVLDLFSHWKAFTMKLDIFTRDINYKVFKYFPNVKNHSNHLEVNVYELHWYIEALKAEFHERSQDFHNYGTLFAFLIRPDLLDLTTNQLELFSWMDIDDFEMQQVEFKSSVLWTSKFVELRKSLEDENLENSTAILNCWASLSTSFICLKRIAFALLSAFGSTYSCEQIFSHMKMKAVLSPQRSCLTPEHSENCVKLKVTKYVADIEQLVETRQGQGSH